MKRFIAILLICTLLASLLTGCDRAGGNTAPDAEDAPVVNFAPETTAVAGQPEAVSPADNNSAAEQPAAVDSTAEAPVAQDATIEPAATEVPVVQPFATATPQPNTQISGYSEVNNTGLGFKFSYPTGWNNIPGRSTVCYVQPAENGTVYPARVAVTMKRLPHKCNDKEAQAELVEYLKLLMSQYDEKTFEVSEELDTDTKFMGEDAFSTSYLAYDGDQEIQGYVILTYFERYLFCYHFLCAYEDYAAFEPAMRRMRDSVQAEQTATEAQ